MPGNGRRRRSTQEAPKRETQSAKSESGGKTSVKYVGPEGQVNREVAAALEPGTKIESGKSYDLPSALAKRLVASSAFWTTD
jgi:hypothetical protein